MPQKIPNISTIKPEEITLELLKKMLDIIKNSNRNQKMVITPINLMILNGAPVADNDWILKQKIRIKKLKKILIELKEMDILAERESKQDFKGMKETGYNII